MTDRGKADSTPATSTVAPITAETFLEGSGLGLAVYRRVLEVVPGAEVRVTKSQIAFRARRGFAWLWRPRMYLGRRGAAIVLSVALPREDRSPRWKDVAHPSPRTWMHHLELAAIDELDEEVGAALREAASAAGAAGAAGPAGAAS